MRAAGTAPPPSGIREPLKVQRQRRVVYNAVLASIFLLLLFIFWFRFLHVNHAVLREEDAEPEFHFVFSTGCNLFQHWQSEALLNSHWRSGQRGQITRVVSGCDTTEKDRAHAKFLTHPEGLGDENVPLALLNRSTNPNFHLHLTPSFPGAKEFPWINKPMGLHHWLQHAKLDANTIVVILDPDEFFLTKLELGRRREHILCTAGCRGDAKDFFPPEERVLHGRPLAQLYGLGGSFVNKFNTKQFAGEDSPAARLNKTWAAKYYSVGPPMIAYADDFSKIFSKWIQYMDPVFQTDPGDIQADMYAYSLAAAHFGLDHLTLDHYMVSVPNTRGEAWPFFDALVERSKIGRCSRPNEFFGPELQPFLHLAHRYDSELTTFMWHKGHVPPNIVSCELPLLIMPEEDLIQTAPSLKQKQGMYMLCNAYVIVNQMLVDWKDKFCEKGTANYKHEIKLMKRSQDCKSHELGKTCWDFARIVVQE